MDVNSFVIGYTKGKQSASGGIELNIAYGDTPPEDTSKLWVKCEEAGKVTVTPNMEEEFDTVGRIKSAIDGYLPVQAAWLSSAIINNEVYFVGNTFKNIYKYDIEAKSGVTLPIEISEAMHYPACVAVENKFYIIGGQTSGSGGYTGLIRYYDPSENTFHEWHKQLPYAVSCACAVYTNGKIYVFGGCNSSARYSEDIYVLNPETFDIEATHSMPAARAWQRASVYGNYVYLFGGAKNSSSASNDIYRFDTTTGECVTIDAKFDTVNGIMGMACATIGKYAFLFGGSNRMSSSGYKNAYRFDMQAESIENVGEFGQKRIGSTGETYGDVIYLIGGNEGINSAYLNSVLRVNLYSYSIPNGDLNIVPELTNPLVLLDGSSAKIKLGVASVYRGNEDNKGYQVEACVYENGTWKSV